MKVAKGRREGGGRFLLGGQASGWRDRHAAGGGVKFLNKGLRAGGAIPCSLCIYNLVHK